MGDNELNVIIKFLMDQASKEAAAKGTGTVADQLERIEKAEKQATQALLNFSKLTTDELQDIVDANKKVEDSTDAMIQSLRAEAKVLRAEANAITDDLKKLQIQRLNTLSQQIGGISRGALIGGTGIIGGIFAGASKYVTDAKEATAVTLQWKAAQDQLSKAGERTGAVFAQEALPLLQKAASLAEQASEFIADNPEIVRAALNTGKVLASLGAVGIAVSKGIKLYADIQALGIAGTQLTAAKLQNAAAQKQLEAALLQAKGLGIKDVGGLGGKAAAGGGLLAGAGIIAGGAALLGVNIALTKSLDSLEESLVKTGVGADKTSLIMTLLQTVMSSIPGLPLVASFRNLEKVFAGLQERFPALKEGFDTLFGKGAKSVESAALGSVQASPAFDQALKAYEDYKRDDLALIQKHYDERQKITADALASERQSFADLRTGIARVRSQSGAAISSATKNFQAEEIKAEQDNARQRAEIIRNAGDDIERIEQDLQERLRKNRLEHEERIEDLTAARDALGLAKEARRFGQQQAEERRDADRQIQERRADIAQQLADLQANFEQQRAQRLADYEARIQEIRANAAAEVAELQAKHREELRQIRAATIAKLKESDAQFTAERQRRYQQFVAALRDLDAALLGEKNLRARYQAAMIADLDKFLAAYKTGLGSLAAGIPQGQTGGYVGGLIRTGETGIEYLLSHRTTQAAESIIGGRLTQEGLIAAMVGGGRNVVWNDQRRFSGEYTEAIRRANRQDTIRLLHQELK